MPTSSTALARLSRIASVGLMTVLIGTAAASAAVTADASRGAAAVAGVLVALNPQPLPPIIDDSDYDYDFFRG